MRRKGTHDWWPLPDPSDWQTSAEVMEGLRELAKRTNMPVLLDTGRVAVSRPAMQTISLPVADVANFNPGDLIQFTPDVEGTYLIKAKHLYHDEMQLEVVAAPKGSKVGTDG